MKTKPMLRIATVIFHIVILQLISSAVPGVRGYLLVALTVIGAVLLHCVINNMEV